MLRNLILSTLILQQAAEGKTLVLPDNIQRQLVSPENYVRLRDTYAGLTPDNVEEVKRKLWELGVLDENPQPSFVSPAAGATVPTGDSAAAQPGSSGVQPNRTAPTRVLRSAGGVAL